MPDCSVTNQGLPAPCSPGYEQFRDATDCAEPSPETGSRGLAEVALTDLPMTVLRPLDPTKVSTSHHTFFRITSVSCEPRYGIEP